MLKTGMKEIMQWPEGGRRGTESGWSEAELKESVRKEAQGVAECGCMAQGKASHNQNCKKQSDVCGVKCIGTEVLFCLASNKFIAKRQP